MAGWGRYGAEYLIARHRTTRGAPPRMMNLIKLIDICDRLDPRAASPYLNRMGRNNALAHFEALSAGLAFTQIWSKARGSMAWSRGVLILIVEFWFYIHWVTFILSTSDFNFDIPILWLGIFFDSGACEIHLNLNSAL